MKRQPIRKKNKQQWKSSQQPKDKVSTAQVRYMKAQAGANALAALLVAYDIAQALRAVKALIDAHMAMAEAQENIKH